MIVMTSLNGMPEESLKIPDLHTEAKAAPAERRKKQSTPQPTDLRSPRRQGRASPPPPPSRAEAAFALGDFLKVLLQMTADLRRRAAADSLGDDLEVWLAVEGAERVEEAGVLVRAPEADRGAGAGRLGRDGGRGGREAAGGVARAGRRVGDGGDVGEVRLNAGQERCGGGVAPVVVVGEDGGD